MRTALPLLVFVGATAATHDAAETPRPRPVAIVYSLSGDTTLSSSVREPRPLTFADRLAVGDSLALGPKARLAIGFISGRRFTVTGPGRAEIAEDGLLTHEARFSELPRVPPLPLLPFLTDQGPRSLRAAAVRVRSEEIPHLRPREGATTLADQTVLRFLPVDGAARYRVEVRDERGELVFSTITETSRIEVPPGKLAAGASYGWSVRTIDRIGPVALGEAGFRTLDRQTALLRADLARAVEVSAEPEASALLATVDWVLLLELADAPLH